MNLVFLTALLFGIALIMSPKYIDDKELVDSHPNFFGIMSIIGWMLVFVAAILFSLHIVGTI